MSAEVVALAVATFLAAAVELVEALTIVLAMGATRGWRPALLDSVAAVLSLAVLTAAAGATLVRVPETLLQLFVGALLLIFGMQWLRSAILRSAGVKPARDEERAFRDRRAEAERTAREPRFGLDWFAFVVSFKGVFLEGLEVVLIVITFGSAADSIVVAATGAAAAAAAVVLLGAAVHRPLAELADTQLKFIVGVLLSTFGAFWAVEGLGVFSDDGESIHWPGGEFALLVLLAGWASLAHTSVVRLRRLSGSEVG